MKQFITAIFLMMAFGQIAHSQQTGSFGLEFDNSGITSQMFFYVPDDYDANKSYDLVYAWHANTMPGSTMRDFIKAVQGDLNNKIIVAPDANNILDKEAAYLSNLITQSIGYTLNTYNINNETLVITGMSLGGAIAYQLGLQNPDLFKGIVGLMPAIAELPESLWANIENIKMATILGDQDLNFSVVDALMKEIETKGGEILYTVKPGVTHIDQEYLNSQEFVNDYNASYNYVLDNAASVQEFDIDENISLFPNPTSEKIYLESDNIHSLGNALLYDENANLLMLASSSTLKQGLDVSKLQAGVYFIKIGNKAQKFIIEK
jgi:pimeloyl-ACP methyl ester carboxylesterase